jgi:hypothetical protein
MAFVVIYDACVLYPAPLRDLLLRMAAKGLVRARWTDQILDECFRNILINRPDLNEASLQRTRDLMNRAIPDVLVTGFEGLIAGLDLPDADDRHVLAAAISAGAQVIVTVNLDDFPADRLTPRPSRRSTPMNSSCTKLTSPRASSAPLSDIFQRPAKAPGPRRDSVAPERPAEAGVSWWSGRGA